MPPCFLHGEGNGLPVARATVFLMIMAFLVAAMFVMMFVLLTVKRGTAGVVDIVLHDDALGHHVGLMHHDRFRVGARYP
ncbi:MAG: hypothetical protein COY40_00470 [Alphaproteobacteria bacterium CG_4_10_14_0_8_um_filter_53_9]|nr:MAG: hypothetical protein COY40_00470 [Alphaproteobacteria bacterium CG_4_10_14_0_8_um_filter_53_9]